jgi:hypothetical protein
VAQRVVADVNQRAIVGLQRIACLEFGYPIVAQDLPIGASGDDLAAQPRANKFAAGDGHDAPPTLAHIAEIERLVDGHPRRKNELERGRRLCGAHDLIPWRLHNGGKIADNRRRAAMALPNAQIAWRA